MAAMTREHAEEFLLWLAAQPHLAVPRGFSSMAGYVQYLRRQVWLDELLDQLAVELRKGGRTRKTPSKLPSSIPQSNPPSTAPRSAPPKAAVHIEDPGDRQDYEEWTTNTRLKWNLNALRAFKALKDGQIKRTGLVGRALRAYTGWGGFTRIFSVLGDVDPELFTPEFAQAFNLWKAAEKQGRPAPSSVLVAEEALRTQYFTPIDVAETMWDYALQLFAGEEIRHVLEPSAGIGRFLDTVPSRKIDPKFYACEYDPRLAELLIARQPDAEVHTGPFESYNVTQGMDLVIGNPPFMDRSRKLLEVARSDIGRAEHFAMIKGLHALRPGGVLLTVTPGSLVTGTTREQISYRAEMYQRGDFRGAVMLPSSCFPGVPGVIVIQAWSRRKTRRSAEEAQALATSPYVFPEVNKLGVWVDGFRGGRVEGVFDAGKAEDVQWLPASEVISGGDLWSRVPDAETSGKRKKRPAAATGTVTAAANTIDFEARSLMFLGQRLAEYYKRLRRPEDLTLAEIGRDELLRDLQEHLARWPQIPLANIPREIERNAWMRYQREGISATPLVDLEERPQPDATPHDTVVHFCRLRGYATDEDLDTYFPGESVVDLLISQGVLIEPTPTGYRYFTELFFLTGNLTARVEAIRAGLEESSHSESVLAALRTGMQKLEAVTENMSIYALRVVPRSGLVPFDILAAWAPEYIGNSSVKLHSDGVLYKLSWQNKPVEQYYEMRKSSFGAKDAWDGVLTRCVHLLGYLNREDTVDLGGVHRHAVFEKLIGFDGRQAQETEIETVFNQWIQLPEQRMYAERIEQEYAERMPQQRGRIYSTEPYPIARKASGITLHAHQNQSTRQQIDQTGGLILDAVGAGKCVIGSTFLPVSQSGSAWGATIEALFPEPMPPHLEEEVLPANGLHVLTKLQGNATLTLQPVRARFRQRLKAGAPLVAIQTTSGGFEGNTLAHPLPVVREGAIQWLPSGQVAEGDYLAVPATLPEPPQPQVVPLDVLELICWHVTEGFDRGSVIQITQHSEVVLNRVRSLVEGLNVGASVRQTSTDVHIRSNTAYRGLLSSYGHTWNLLSADERLPDWFPMLERSLLRHALRVVFSAEGSAGNKGVEISSASKMLLTQIQYALLRFGIRGARREKPVNGKVYHRLSITGVDAQKYAEEIGFLAEFEYKTQALSKIPVEHNTNLGIPVAALLRALPLPQRMYGVTLNPGQETLDPATTLVVVAQLRYWATEAGQRAYQQVNAGARGRSKNISTAVLAFITSEEGRSQLVTTADQIDAMSCWRYDRVKSVKVTSTTQETVVYDLSVDTPDYNDANYVAGMGGLIAHNTFVASSSLALWRQMGRSRRTIIVVPNNNRIQWATQLQRFLPDYSVCLMGITGRREDSQAERLTKWQAFRDGLYEVMVVGHHGFLRDVYVDQEHISEHISEQEWLQRSAGRKLAEIKRAQEALAALERSKIRQLEAIEAEREKDPRRYYTGGEANTRTNLLYDRRVEQITANMDAEIAKAQEKLSKLKPPTDKEILDAIGAAEERASVGFRPDNAANLISWTELIGDDSNSLTMIVDEAHYYKNLWFPEARLGAGTIAYMGSTKSTKASQDGEDKGLTLLCWDLLFKTNILTKGRTDKQGVMLMTATPFKNSPLELYNLGCYLGEDFWQKIGIKHKEDFIDRYLEIAETTYVNPGDITSRVGPGVIRFKERDLKDLVSYLAPVLQRRTKEDLQAAGIIRLPERVAHQVPVEMTGVQRRVSDAIKVVAELRIYRRMAIKANKEAGADGTWVQTIQDPYLADLAGKLTTVLWTEEAESSANLMVLDLLRKVATDPRLLLNDWERVYGTEVEEKGEKKRKGKVKDISDATRFVYDHVFEVLEVLGISVDTLRVKQTSEKLRRAARMLAEARKKQIKENGKADGSLVFLDYVDAHEWLISELVALGVPRGKIARISGDVGLSLRDEIANGKFNAADQPVHGGFNGVQELRDTSGAVIRAACEPEYDILIGTSGAMAEGLNLQYRTSALYHLTYTWEPATIEQREGRAIRQGNVHPKVDVYQLFSEQSFDGVLINVSEGKASWQNEVFKGNAPMFQQDSDSDREDLLIKHVVRDPETARELFAQIRAERQAAEAIRNKRAAWELYLRCYRTLRQRETEASPERRDALLGGMRAVLRDTPRHIVGQLPPAALNAMSRGQICFPDMTNKHVFFIGDQQISGELAEKTVRILTAQVTDTAIQLYYRDLSNAGKAEVNAEIFNVASTGIYRPGYVSSAERIAAKGRGASPPDWSVISPPFRALVGQVQAVTMVEPMPIQDELARFAPSAIGAYTTQAISALAQNVYPPVYDLKLAQAYYASVNRKFQRPGEADISRYDLFSDRVLQALRTVGVYFGNARTTTSVFTGLPLRTADGHLLVASRGYFNVPYGRNITFTPVDRLLMPGDAKDYEDLMAALTAGTLMVQEKYNPEDLNQGVAISSHGRQKGDMNAYFLSEELIKILATMKVFWPTRRPSTVQLRQIFRLLIPHQTGPINPRERLISAVSQIFGIPEKVLQGIFKDVAAQSDASVAP